MSEEWLPATVAAATAGVSPPTLRHWIQTGKVSAMGTKHGRLVKLTDV
jgi:hypothetical protein